MKTFELPVSDCGCFVVGFVDEGTVASMNTLEKKMPEFGVIVWYESEEAAKAAFKAAQEAHWPSSVETADAIRKDMIEAVISFIEGGRFLHDEAPPKLFATEVVSGIRRAFDYALSRPNRGGGDAGL